MFFTVWSQIFVVFLPKRSRKLRIRWLNLVSSKIYNLSKLFASQKALAASILFYFFYSQSNHTFLTSALLTHDHLKVDDIHLWTQSFACPDYLTNYNIFSTHPGLEAGPFLHNRKALDMWICSLLPSFSSPPANTNLPYVEWWKTTRNYCLF